MKIIIHVGMPKTVSSSIQHASRTQHPDLEYINSGSLLGAHAASRGQPPKPLLIFELLYKSCYHN